ncbi:MAG: gluconeogenesis factor YvcK family protein [Peptoniphilus sp.]|nr:gluconeogenesis factor YvcK family protein [Peptoniphilus sp.]MDD7363256.1 YvcK family protein [Bacillota bacterium]MDY6045349.1 gluconeogenesis factor YvcK family protein [Peptoniphilus sp.]
MLGTYDPKFVVIGGGTGISTILRGLKRFSEEVTAIVTMADDGGSSGILRREYGMLPPGDVRNCLVALANAEPSLKKLLQYRFKEGDLKGQNMGNLIITALADIYGGFAEGVSEAGDVLKITGRVLPVTVESIHLVARFSDGSEIEGESRIPDYAAERNLAIESIRLDTKESHANAECVAAIEEADMIVLGPGSLYTSLIPNLLVPGIAEAIGHSKAPLVYVANIMEQRGETVGMRLAEYLEALEAHGLKRQIDSLIVNDEEIDGGILDRYEEEEGVGPIRIGFDERKRFVESGIAIEHGAFVITQEGYIRHDGLAVAQRLLSLCDRYREIHCKSTESEL